jgi:hypothetical protein
MIASRYEIHVNTSDPSCEDAQSIYTMHMLIEAQNLVEYLHITIKHLLFTI